MNNKRRILFIQHAGGLGGSAMSLLFMVRALDRSKYEPIVALIRSSKDLVELYENAGIHTVSWSGIQTFEHTTAKQYSLMRPGDWVAAIRFLLTIKSTLQSVRRLVAHVRPDLIHLNSVVLAVCAWGLASGKLPVVWHVREHPVRGILGCRYRWLCYGLKHWADRLIFISEADRLAWGMPVNGVVVRNFVDLTEFDRKKNGEALKSKLRISNDSPVLLYAGGPLRIKGVLTLLDALALLKESHPSLRCLMPGSSILADRSVMKKMIRALMRKVGLRTISIEIERRVQRYGLELTCVILPFQVEMAEFLGCADVVLFPSIRPHFARPMIEAAAMAKPVVASRLEGITELVDEGETGLLVTAGDPRELAVAVSRLLKDKALAERMGEQGYAKARVEFSAAVAVRTIEELYKHLLEQ